MACFPAGGPTTAEKVKGMVPGTQVIYRSTAGSQAEVLWFENYLSASYIVAWLGQKSLPSSHTLVCAAAGEQGRLSDKGKGVHDTFLPSFCAVMLIAALSNR